MRVRWWWSFWLALVTTGSAAQERGSLGMAPIVLAEVRSVDPALGATFCVTQVETAMQADTILIHAIERTDTIDPQCALPRYLVVRPVCAISLDELWAWWKRLELAVFLCGPLKPDGAYSTIRMMKIGPWSSGRWATRRAG